MAKRRRNQHIWRLTRRLLQRKGFFALSVFFAIVSASGVAVGLPALVPILKNLIGGDEGKGRPLSQLVAEHAPRLAEYGVDIPSRWVQAMPSGRYESVLWTVVFLAVLTVVGSAARAMHSFCAISIVTRAVYGVRRDAFARVQRAPLLFMGSSASDATSRIVHDSDTLAQGLTALLLKAFGDGFRAVAALGMALWLDVTLVLVLIPTGLVYTVFIRKLGKRIRRSIGGMLEAKADLLGIAAEALRGARVVKVYGAESHEDARFDVSNHAVRRHGARARFMRSLSTPIMECMSILLVGALTVYTVGRVIRQEIEPEEFFAVLIALGFTASSAKPVAGLSHSLQTADAAAERLCQILDMPEERTGGSAAPRLTESLAFRGVSFAYPGAESDAVSGVDLQIHAGTTVAFVGPNGCGKTTLLSLVPRLYEPTQGCLEFDGHDAATLSLDSIRGQIAVVTQEVVLLPGTVADNIRFGATGIRDDEVVRAAQRAHADGFIRGLSKGYDTLVGEQGAGLSGGQRQRISLARAILRDPAVLILDEATSMIDPESEVQIAKALREFGQGRTCLVVAHRMATVRGADTVVVMRDGRIVDTGAHEELLGRSGLYRALAQDGGVLSAVPGTEAEPRAN